MKQIRTEIIIDAPIEQVWDVLSDLKSWKLWNPFIVNMSGTAEKGAVLTNKISQNGKDFVFKPKVLVADKNSELTWLGSMGLPGLFDGRHSFLLYKKGLDKTLLIHQEQFKGLLSGLIFKKIGVDTQEGFVAMNKALKKCVEEGLASH